MVTLAGEKVFIQNQSDSVWFPGKKYYNIFTDMSTYALDARSHSQREANTVCLVIGNSF